MFDSPKPILDERIKCQQGHGLIQLIHGHGKGKTAAALGQAVRCGGGKREGAKRVSVVAETKAAADVLARDLAKRDGVELFIHGLNGRIQDRDSFGKDPHPPIDKHH